MTMTREFKKHIMGEADPNEHVVVRLQQWVTILALLIQAKSYCPPKLQREIRIAFRRGWS